MEKCYNDTTDTEKHIIREYTEWKQADCDYEYKLIMLEQWYKRAVAANIQHLL
jgi:hypothetical protein